MECPSCSNGVLLAPSEGDKGLCCTQCDGLWLEKDTLNSLCNGNELDPDILRAKLKTERRVDNGRACPSCAKTLAVSAVNKIELDWCETCEGVWFDRGESQKVLADASDKDEVSISESIFAGITMLEFVGMIFKGLS